MPQSAFQSALRCSLTPLRKIIFLFSIVYLQTCMLFVGAGMEGKYKYEGRVRRGKGCDVLRLNISHSELAFVNGGRGFAAVGWFDGVGGGEMVRWWWMIRRYVGMLLVLFYPSRKKPIEWWYNPSFDWRDAVIDWARFGLVWFGFQSIDFGVDAVQVYYHQLQYPSTSMLNSHLSSPFPFQWQYNTSINCINIFHEEVWRRNKGMNRYSQTHMTW